MQKKTNVTNNNKNVGKGSKSQGRKRSASTNRESHSNKFSNDPNWYAVDANILRDAASVPYSIPTGSPINISGAFDDSSFAIPGVMAYELAPTVGKSVLATDPINIAATQSYAYIRHANSGSANYDSSDIMIYFLAMADVYSYIEYLKRMYGVVQVYAQKNKYVPYTLLRAMKVEPSTLINNLANFRLGVNMLINKAASFAVPNTMSLFPRRQFLYSGIYTEGSSIRDQIYLYVPHGFHMYDWENMKTEYLTLKPSKVAQLIGKTSTTTENAPMDAMDLVAVGHAMIDKIINNEDMGIMNGDILKAYGDNVLKLSHLAEDYAIAPVYDPYVLEQMQNASVFADCFIGHEFEVTSEYTTLQDGTKGLAILKSNPKVVDLAAPLTATLAQLSEIKQSSGYMLHKGSHVLATILPEPEAKDTMEITRLMATIDSEDSLICGTEVCTGCTIYHTPYYSKHTGGASDYSCCDVNQFVWVGNWGLVKSRFMELTGLNWNGDFLTALNMPDEMQYIGAFKHRPHLYFYDLVDQMANWKKSVSITTGAKGIDANLSNFTIIDNAVAEKLHMTAVMNEFATPHVAIIG